MKVIPAVDISGGKCVRLTRGRINDSKVYYEDPLEAARRWEGEGAKMLHLIDLDAAVGAGENSGSVMRVIRGVSIPVEVGGGIRSLEKARGLIAGGAAKVIIGTAATDLKIVRDSLRELGPEKIMVAVDHLMGRVAIRGWKEVVDLDAATLCRRLEEEGVRSIMMTSIDRDGTMKGPNLEYALKAAGILRSEVYLAGGFSSLGDILLLRNSRIAGVIIGKALYEGKISLKAAMEEANWR
ncbi:MAG: 1-(5-phosphoribosyl)-5-[(5-phosphoribosylamino)methylideneamino]imidazole-4-carboxamide isomerase [Candidatus Methanomethylicia archaeon]|nr:1-(5-phosphoribosyl)-5-[(5-phosphoribosylamino)methylideneamino]imidazole-4-carboxamide isomerase [Candidatus Methanomethylicia archaeon]